MTASLCSQMNAHAPAAMPRPILALFAVASGMSVANVYYAQPLLDALAAAFAIEPALIGAVVGATQLGCALALLLLVPLGDRLDRRRLLLGQIIGLLLSLVLVALSGSVTMLLTGMLLVGLLGTAMTQGLIAHAAASAKPEERGRVIGAAQGGVFIGLLLARVISGGIADLGGWRSVYLLAAVMMTILAVPLWRYLPTVPSGVLAPGYARLLGSMLTLLKTDRTLQVRGTLALFMFATFNVFWSALVLPLTGPAHGFSHTQVGALGLVGACGALMAARAGHWADRGWAQRTSAVALTLLVLAWWPLAGMEHSLPALLLGIVLLDVGGQALHVTNQSLILRGQSDAHGRLVALYMLFYALGSGTGAVAATYVYARHGWLGVCILGATLSASALGFWIISRRYAEPRGVA